ncbi:MAG: COX15/CtaA family protein [Flavobacteriales bacterium]|nr:COX15/CtaA family protein [Flavobacteriales bacterium]
MRNNTFLLVWLFTGAAMVLIQVAIGGITRLTHSGLSMVDWHLIMGALPPLSEKAWLEAFAKYKLSPEFIHINSHFGLEAFKRIYWWEYFHRLFGRLIGLVFIIPFVWMLFKKMLNQKQILQLLAVFLLGAIQAFLGWYMVKSGLVKEPRVSHFRLAAHLITAFITCLLIWRIALPLLIKPRLCIHNPSLRRWSLGLLILSVLQVIYGAFVAGLRAGGSHNTYPLMDEQWIADSVWALEPVWRNWLEGVSGVQFVHRLLAHILLLLVFWLWIKRKTVSNTALQLRGIHFITSLVLLQFLLGVFTLLLRVPLWLGIAHQITALLFMAALVYTRFTATENSR